MNTLILMGRGIEGAGNTRLSIEIEEYLIQENNNVTIIANSEKKWPRGKAHANDIELHDFSQAIYESHVEFDNIIVMSVPASKFSETGKENFTLTLENYKNINIVYIQVDHKLASINRNYYGKEPYTTRFFSCINKVMTNCIDNDFLNKFVARKVDLDKINGLETIGMVMISADFDSLTKVSTKEKLPKTIHFLGRSPVWKGWIDLAKLHQSHLQDAGFSTQIEGIEMSIGVVSVVLKSTKPERIPFDYFWLGYKEDPNKHLGHKDISAQLYGPYVRDDAIKRVAISKFAAFTTFVGEQFGGMIEAAFLEMAATKTPVIIKKELYEHGRLNNGEWLRDFSPQDMGVILYDVENPQKLLDELTVLEEDTIIYDEYRENVYNFWKSRFDRSVMLPLMMKEILKTPKQYTGSLRLGFDE